MGERRIETPTLRITREEYNRLDIVHQLVAKALIKTGEIVIVDSSEGLR